jgi:hypothetical protein
LRRVRVLGPWQDAQKLILGLYLRVLGGCNVRDWGYCPSQSCADFTAITMAQISIKTPNPKFRLYW